MASQWGTEMHGGGTGVYVTIAEVNEDTSRATQTMAYGTISIYMYAVRDVINGYNFTNGNALVIAQDKTNIVNVANAGTVRCQNSGTKTLIYTANWSKARTNGACSILFEWAFVQTQSTNFSSSGSMTFTCQSLNVAPTGFLDGITMHDLGGWAAKPGDDTSVSVKFEVYKDGTLIQTTTIVADQYREDLKTAGYGSGYHGFHYDCDWAVQYGSGTYTAKAYALYGTNNSQQVQLNGDHSGEFNSRGTIAVWDGSKWHSGDLYVYNGSAWVKAKGLYVYNGSSWAGRSY